MSLYTDYIIAYISDLLHTVTTLMECINQFGKHSGSKINIGKTEPLDINTLITTQVKSFSFRWPKEVIEYLGVVISSDFNNLYDRNYTKLLEQIIQI